MTLILDDLLVEERGIESDYKIASEKERLQEYAKLFANLCTMDREQGLAAMKALHNFKQKEPIRFYIPLWFKDGTSISVQASGFHKCEPPITLERAEDYDSFEVKTDFYVEGWGTVGKEKIYSYVPKEDLKKLLIKKLMETGLML